MADRRHMQALARAFMSQADRAGIESSYDRPTGLLTTGDQEFDLGSEQDLLAAQEHSVAISQRAGGAAEDRLQSIETGRRVGPSTGAVSTPDPFATVRKAAAAAPPAGRAEAIKAAIAGKGLLGSTFPGEMVEAGAGSGVMVDPGNERFVTSVRTGAPAGGLEGVTGSALAKLKSGDALSETEAAVITRLLKRKRGRGG